MQRKLLEKASIKSFQSLSRSEEIFPFTSIWFKTKFRSMANGENLTTSALELLASLEESSDCRRAGKCEICKRNKKGIRTHLKPRA